MEKLKKLSPRRALELLKQHKWMMAFLLSCLLAFLGPTYIVYILYQADLSWPVPDLLGFALFSIGLISIAYIAASKPETSG